MTSSDRRRPAGKSGTAAEPESTAGARRNAQAHDQLDPWFAPGPKSAAASADSQPGGDDGGMLEPDTAQWFLPSGRAGLLPESMTISDVEDEADRSLVPPPRHEAHGAPPWAADASGSPAASPPPWENGPWPGPSSQRRSRPTAQGPAGAAPRRGATADTGAGPGGPWPARTVLIAGLVPLVIPGLVAGAVTLRRSRAGDPARRAGILALAASLAWALVIVVVVLATSGSSAPPCTYPAAVHQAYQRVVTDLSSHASASVQAADLSVAVGRANAAAASTGVLTVRTALFALASDLELARGDVTAGRPVPATLLSRLVADGAALSQACPR